jgi:hypothetical protein
VFFGLVDKPFCFWQEGFLLFISRKGAEEQSRKDDFPLRRRITQKRKKEPESTKSLSEFKTPFALLRTLAILSGRTPDSFGAGNILSAFAPLRLCGKYSLRLSGK